MIVLYEIAVIVIQQSHQNIGNLILLNLKDMTKLVNTTILMMSTQKKDRQKSALIRRTNDVKVYEKALSDKNALKKLRKSMGCDHTDKEFTRLIESKYVIAKDDVLHLTAKLN